MAGMGMGMGRSKGVFASEKKVRENMEYIMLSCKTSPVCCLSCVCLGFFLSFFHRQSCLEHTVSACVCSSEREKAKHVVVRQVFHERALMRQQRENMITRSCPLFFTSSAWKTST